MAQLAVALKDIIFQSASEQVSKPPPSVQARRAACTHMTMSKLYGPFRCSHCNQMPRLGWLYRCTQDRWTRESLKRSRGIDSKVFATEGAPEEDDGTSIVQLTPWMEEAILNGLYTPEESTILREQKQEVKDSIAIAEHNLNQQHRAAYTYTPPRPTMTSNNNVPFPIIEEAPEELTLLPQLPPTNKPSAKHKLIPECFYKTCLNCRPLSRDRAWQSFDHIFKNVDPPSTVDFSVDNRPVSDVDIVRQLGLPKPRPRFRSFSNVDLTSNNENRQIPRKDTPSSPTDTENGPSKFYTYDNHRDSQGFRESARRAFHHMFISPRRRSRASNASSRSSRKARREQEDYEESDLGLQLDLIGPKLLLFQAAATRLPGLDGMDGLDTEEAEPIVVVDEGGEVLVPDGVAVTEEAVDLGSADIIMSV